jgi:hypothetical protein
VDHNISKNNITSDTGLIFDINLLSSLDSNITLSGQKLISFSEQIIPINDKKVIPFKYKTDSYSCKSWIRNYGINNPDKFDFYFKLAEVAGIHLTRFDSLREINKKIGELSSRDLVVANFYSQIDLIVGEPMGLTYYDFDRLDSKIEERRIERGKKILQFKKYNRYKSLMLRKKLPVDTIRLIWDFLNNDTWKGCDICIGKNVPIDIALSCEHTCCV